MLMHYFLGYSSSTNEEPFSPALFVEIRERLSMKILSKINDVIAVLCIEKEEVANQKNKKFPVDPPVELNQASRDVVPKETSAAELQAQQAPQTEQILQATDITHAEGMPHYRYIR